MKRRLKELAILGAVLGVIGITALVSGVVPVNASSGHWDVTRWVLDYASDRSVGFHSRGIDVPALVEPGMITLGAATYESNCVFCHGQPGERQPPVARGMTPTPPLLNDSIVEKEPRELFYIVKHGIKFAGMPAWPTQKRDDEIWPVVAFLSSLPTMDNAAYLDRVRWDDQDLPDVSPIQDFAIEHCAACHGVDGNGRAGKRVPTIAGQNEGYLRESLLAYRMGERNSGIMMPVAHRLTDDEIDGLASYFASQQRTSSKSDGDAEETTFRAGERLAAQGDRKDKIPSCVDCHGPGETRHSDDYPRLAGLSRWYLERQLELFSLRHRGGSENANLMHPIADKLDADQRHALALYYSTADMISEPEAEGD
ncbi:c-type cytochrome [Aporhodopirellula aestuarii]|uniref:C-type cytochrome n=1 Tax=Aporhodopirellula aestuarii TaxID=2950107 RepID=A0ABT0UD99_9BACT|nr:c-type cytochrome [Aporhodopirellula aestuarii]MCM2374880.1 c-type cytochrome [Aporhodopirellula aestuarii]